MGSVAYVRQVWLDVDWSTKADAIYQKNPRGVARPRYDRTNAVLAEALEDHAVVLIPRESEEHTSELQSHLNLVCRLLLEKKKTRHNVERKASYALAEHIRGTDRAAA